MKNCMLPLMSTCINLVIIIGRRGEPEFREIQRLFSPKLQIACEPYKSKGIIEYVLNGELGKTYTLNGPAKETVPIVTCTSPTIINLNGQSFAFEPGTWTNEDMVLHHGKNIVHVNTTLDYGKAV